MFPEEARIEHMKKYFAYEHLPAHLQEASKPFCLLSKQIDIGCSVAEVVAAIFDLLDSLMPELDHLEIEAATGKLNEAIRCLTYFRYAQALRLILEAKDCAVRAAVK